MAPEQLAKRCEKQTILDHADLCDSDTDKADSTAVSLGEYKESPVFRNGHLSLTYYNGSTDSSSTCNGKVQTVITFTCAYGK